MTRSGPLEPVLQNGRIADWILEFRSARVILDADLARLYGVATRVLNQAVKRNADRFPRDFVFRLSPEEVVQVSASRSQPVILKRGQNVKFAPFAFTEHGALTAASVLDSPSAVEMSLFVVRAFVRLSDFARGHQELARQLAAVERRVSGHDVELQRVLAALRQLLEPPSRPRRPIGFRG